MTLKSPASNNLLQWFKKSLDATKRSNNVLYKIGFHYFWFVSFSQKNPNVIAQKHSYFSIIIVSFISSADENCLFAELFNETVPKLFSESF